MPGESAVGIQAYQPMGQSFTPRLSAVGFVQLQLMDLNPRNSLGATLYVNLRATSITGPVLATTDRRTLPDGFGGTGRGFTNFLFSTPAEVSPGTMYYFQPVVESGDVILAGAFIPTFDYPGGTGILKGSPVANDLWFREGIIIPEPRGAWLALIGGGMFMWHRRVGKASGRPPPIAP